MIYCFLFTFIGTEYRQRWTCFYYLFATVLLLAAMLVVAIYEDEFPRRWTVWITAIFAFCILMNDLIRFANHRQVKIFYVPFLIEILILCLGLIMLHFRVPERWCKKTKFVNLYLSSQVFFVIFMLNFVVEMTNILYYTCRINSNTLDDDEAWWEIANIWNT